MNIRHVYLPVLCFVMCFAGAGCGNSTVVRKEGKAAIETATDSAYAGWETVEGEKIKIRYPDDWVVKTKEFGPNAKMFGFTEKGFEDLEHFFPLEIYEIRTTGIPSFRMFKFGASDWMDQRFDKKHTIRNTEDISFKGMEARKYEVDMPGEDRLIEFEVYVLNGISRYYVMVYFKANGTEPAARKIMNSILAYK